MSDQQQVPTILLGQDGEPPTYVNCRFAATAAEAIAFARDQGEYVDEGTNPAEVSRVLYEAGIACKRNIGPPWEQLEQPVREAWHEYADAALAAARLPEQPDDEGITDAMVEAAARVMTRGVWTVDMAPKIARAALEAALASCPSPSEEKP